MAWRVGFGHPGGHYKLDLFTAERKLDGDWEAGGFAMSVALGTVARTDAGRKMRVASWAELLI